MKDNGLHSHFAQLGIALAFLLPILALTTGVLNISSGPETNLNDGTHISATWADEIDRKFTDNQFIDGVFEDEEVSETPCYEVSIDESLLVSMERYRSDMLGENLLDIEELLTDDFKTSLSQHFSTRIWQTSKNCFEGSFIVSFSVNEDGKLGADMLVHHLTGRSNAGGSAVIKTLFDLQDEGHVWHDGTESSGEVRLPVRFKLHRGDYELVDPNSNIDAERRVAIF